MFIHEEPHHLNSSPRQKGLDTLALLTLYWKPSPFPTNDLFSRCLKHHCHFPSCIALVVETITALLHVSHFINHSAFNQIREILVCFYFPNCDFFFITFLFLKVWTGLSFIVTETGSIFMFNSDHSSLIPYEHGLMGKNSCIWSINDGHFTSQSLTHPDIHHNETLVVVFQQMPGIQSEPKHKYGLLHQSFGKETWQKMFKAEKKQRKAICSLVKINNTNNEEKNIYTYTYKPTYRIKSFGQRYWLVV